MPRPVLQAMVLADHVYQDRLSGKFIISGTFGRIAIRPPQNQPQAIPPAPAYQPPPQPVYQPPKPAYQPPPQMPAAQPPVDVAPPAWPQAPAVEPAAPVAPVQPAASPQVAPPVSPAEPGAPIASPQPPAVSPPRTPPAAPPPPAVPVSPAAAAPPPPPTTPAAISPPAAAHLPPAPMPATPHARPMPPPPPPDNRTVHSLDTAGAVLSVAGSPYLYLALTGIHGKVPLAIRFVNQGEDEMLFEALLEVMSADPVSGAEYCVPMPQLPITKPGTYSVDLLYQGEIIGSWRLIASIAA